MSGVRIVIDKLKNIDNFDFTFPITSGVNLICGSNGVGKSTLMTVFAKIVYATALNNYFKNDDLHPDSKVTYHYGGLTHTWIKNPQKSWSDLHPNEKPIKLEGFFEGSFIYGNRFSDAHKSKINRILNIREKDFVDADDFVIENLGYIVKGDKKYYQGLKRTNDNFDFKSLNLSRPCYTWFSPSRKVNQFKMSSGEYLVLTLLDYLKERLDFIISKYERSSFYKRKVNDECCNPKTLIILDEADMALHPSAQERLVDFLHEICSNYERITDICVYIATHSTSVIMKENKGSIYLLDNNKGELSVTNNCYPAYAMRDVSDGVFFDKLILVEDKLAKNYVDKVIRNRLSQKNVIYKVLYVGGYREVISLHKQISNARLGGAKEVISILDGDIKREAHNYIKNNNLASLNVQFLDFKSIEKYIYENVFENTNRKLISGIENSFLKIKSMRMVITEYKLFLKDGSDEKELKKGKVFWKFLLNEVVSQGEQEDIFIDHVCDLIRVNIGHGKMEEDLINYIDS